MLIVWLIGMYAAVLAAFILSVWVSTKWSSRIPKMEWTSFWSTATKRQKFVLIWIWLVFAGVVIGVILISDENNTLLYKRKLPEPPDFFYYHDMFLNKTDINHPDNVYDVKIRIASQTFSVQMPIWIEWVNVTQTQGESYNDTLILIFPRAIYETGKPPGAFERTQVVMILSPPKGGFRDGASSPGPTITYSMQGCYNIVLAAPQPGLASRQLYENDCTELNIDGIDIRKSLELERENIKIQNLLIDQNNVVIKISMVALLALLATFVIGVLLAWLFSYNRGEDQNAHQTQKPQ